VKCGMAWFAQREDGWEAASERTFAAQGIPCTRLDVAEASKLYLSFLGDDLAFVLLDAGKGGAPSRLLPKLSGVFKGSASLIDVSVRRGRNCGAL
jgi:hypothetical protein